MSTLRVKGTATATAMPDAVDVRLDVKARDKDYATAMQQIETQVSALKDAIACAGVLRDTIRTSYFNVDAETDYVDGQRTFLGYAGTHRLETRIDFDRPLLNAILSAAAESGAEPGARLNFIFRDESGLRDEALRQAVASATQTAELLANAAGTTLGVLRAITHGIPERESIGLSLSVHSVPQIDCCRLPDLADEISPSEIKSEQTVEMSWHLAESAR